MMRTILLAALAVTACQSQGKYTGAAGQEARDNLNVLRAGTDYDQALRQLEIGDLDRALKTIDTCIARIPNVEKSYLLRGRILIERGDLNEALATLEVDIGAAREAEAGSETEPRTESSEFPYLRGVVNEQLGNLDAALAEYRTALEIEPGRPEVILAQAEVLVSLGQVDAARELLDVDKGELATHPGFRQALGQLALLEMDLPKAETLFGEAAILSPRDQGILEDLLRVQVARANYADALRTFEHLEPLEGRDDLRRLQAYCLVQTRQPVEARSVLMGVTRDPDGAEDYESWKLMADAAIMLDDDRLLRSAADRMLQLGPARPEGFLTLAVWKRRAGDLQGALLSARQAVERAGEDPTPKRLEELLLRDLAAADG